MLFPVVSQSTPPMEKWLGIPGLCQSLSLSPSLSLSVLPAFIFDRGSALQAALSLSLNENTFLHVVATVCTVNNEMCVKVHEGHS